MRASKARAGRRTGRSERWRHREAVGNVIIVRYADDLIIGHIAS